MTLVKHTTAMTTLLFLTGLLFSACTMESDDLTTPSTHALRTEMIQYINSIRARGCRCGNESFPPAPPLRWDERLEKAARRHAHDMSTNDHFDHTGTDGSSTAQRVADAGYSYRLVGENIAYGHPTLKSVIDDWLASPGHCKNLMNAAYSEMGAAAQNGYWVQTLGLGL